MIDRKLSGLNSGYSQETLPQIISEKLCRTAGRFVYRSDLRHVKLTIEIPALYKYSDYSLEWCGKLVEEVNFYGCVPGRV